MKRYIIIWYDRYNNKLFSKECKTKNIFTAIKISMNNIKDNLPLNEYKNKIESMKSIKNIEKYFLEEFDLLIKIIEIK